MEKGRSTLTVPQLQSQRYERNFIQTAVCELKFPILLELESKPPAKIQKNLRKEYPHFEKVDSVEVITGGKTESKTHYNLLSSDRKWIVGVKPDAVSVETTRYTTFEDFFEKLQFVVQNILDAIDSNYFTRVGLRYINLIPFPNNDFTGYINPALVGPLEDRTYGTVIQFAQKVQGHLEDGMYSFRHGIRPKTDASEAKPEYYLDFDYFKEMVEVGDALSLVRRFHDYNFSFFYWCLGEKAIKLLGKATPKDSK